MESLKNKKTNIVVKNSLFSQIYFTVTNNSMSWVVGHILHDTLQIKTIRSGDTLLRFALVFLKQTLDLLLKKIVLLPRSIVCESTVFIRIP